LSHYLATRALRRYRLDDVYLIIARDFVALFASFAMIPTLLRDQE
jgi:hypothetical protein